jgi:hypothetical protein
MHFHRTVSSSRCRPHSFSGVLLVLCCLTGAILAQTFQYSRGWTNGRKRAGPAPPLFISPSASGSGLLQSTEESSAAISNPCSQLQRIKFLLGARNPQHVCTWLQNCGGIGLHTTHYWNVTPVAYRGGVGGCSTPPPEIPKALQNRDKLNPIVKNVKNCWI